VPDVQIRVGHGSLATTALDTKSDDARRFALVDQLVNTAV